MLDAVNPLAVVARAIRAQRRGRIVQPILPLVGYLGEAVVARDDRNQSRY